MNASVMKPQIPFVSRGPLNRTPASEDNKKITEYIEAHDFSFDLDLHGELVCTVTEKRD